MKILVLNSSGNSEIKHSSFIPRVGENVDMFYRPMPTVSNVINWPSKAMLKDVNAENMEIDVVIMVS